MRIYLVQHGDAVSKDIDPNRPLSRAGQEDVEAVANLLARARVEVPSVVHSGKLRAKQTAEILVAQLNPDSTVQVKGGIGPNDPVEPVAKDISAQDADMMIVGHLPFMGKLAARLVAGDADHAVVSFVPGTVACIESVDEGEFSVAWMVRPNLAQQGGS